MKFDSNPHSEHEGENLKRNTEIEIIGTKDGNLIPSEAPTSNHTDCKKKRSSKQRSGNISGLFFDEASDVPFESLRKI